MSLPALIVGAVIPDIEVPLMWIFFPNVQTDHLLLHSFLGAFTIGLSVAFLVTVFIYRPIISRIFNLASEDLDEWTKPSRIVMLSCAIGISTHLIVDYPMHVYNPLLWPMIDPYALAGPLVVLLATDGNLTLGFLRANLAFNIIHLLMCAYILRKEWGETLWGSIWIEPAGIKTVHSRGSVDRAKTAADTQINS